MTKRFASVVFFLIHQSLIAQNVEVIIDLKSLPPFITKFNSEQMSQKLSDSLTLFCSEEISAFTSRIHFLSRNQPSNLEVVDYKLYLMISDTIVSNTNHDSIYFVLVNAAFNEANLSLDSVQWIRSGISYGYDSEKITEMDAISGLIAATRIAANNVLLDYLPLSLTMVLPSRNMSFGWLTLLEFSNNIVIKIKSNDLIGDSSVDVKRIRTLIGNILLRRQDFYYKARFQKAYFNYYVDFDSLPTQVWKTNPLKIELLINPHPRGYSIQLQSASKNIDLRPSESHILINRQHLETRPTLVNSQLADLIASFIYRNL